MQRTLILALLVLFIGCKNYVNVRHKKTDWERQGLKGNVKKMIRHVYANYAVLNMYYIVEYNKQGHIVLDSRKGKDAELTINEKGTLLYERDNIVRKVESNDKRYTASVTKIDSKGNISLVEYFNKKGKLVFVDRYDSKENIIESSYFKPKTKRIRKTRYEYTYDNKNNILESREYKDNKLVEKNVCSYKNAKLEKKLITRYSIISDYKTTGKEIMQYDKNGNLATIDSYDQYDRKNKSTFVAYDNKGNQKQLQSETYESDGKKIYIEEYSYEYWD